VDSTWLAILGSLLLVAVVYLVAYPDDRRRIHRLLLRAHPYKFLFGALPSPTASSVRWSLFQVFLSIIFSLTASGVAILTINTSEVGRTAMAIAYILFGLAFLAIVYTIGIGVHWYETSKDIKSDAAAQQDRDVARQARDEELLSTIRTTNEKLDKVADNLGRLAEEIRNDRENQRRQSGG